MLFLSGELPNRRAFGRDETCLYCKLTYRKTFKGLHTEVIIGHQPKQCTIIREIHQNYETFAFFDPLKKWATFKDPFHIPLKQPGLPKTEPQRTLRSVAALTWKAYEEIVHSFTAHFF